MSDKPGFAARALVRIRKDPDALVPVVLFAILGVALVTWMAYIQPRIETWAAEASAERAAVQTARAEHDRVCREQGPKNARAWAAVMRLKDPVVLCRPSDHYTPYPADCLTRAACSVGTDGAVYGLECTVESTEDEGQADRCMLAVTGGGTAR